MSRADADAARELATAWIEARRWELGDDDHACFAWLREVSPLAARVPAELAPTYARPPSQLLALLEPHTGPARPSLSPVLALQRDRVIGATLRWIDRAFDGVPVPDEDHRTIFQAEAADNHGWCDRARDHLGRWQDLPDEHLLENPWALAHLDEQGIHYYLPALMSFALRAHLAHDHWIVESLGYTLQPSSGDLRTYQQGRFARLDREQRAAIYAFALMSGNRRAAEAWWRVFDAEREAVREDWFALYSPA